MKIDRVHIGITTCDGARKLVTLPAIRKHCRKERVEDLLEDLILICEDVESAYHHPCGSGAIFPEIPRVQRSAT